MAIDLTTSRGTPAFTAGKFSNALSSGVLAHVGNSFKSTVGTVEAWLKTSVTGAVQVAFGNDKGMWFGLWNNNTACLGGPSSATQGSTNLADGLWHHFALTADGSNLKLWVDGALATQQGYTGTFDPTYGTDATGGTTALRAFGAQSSYDWGGAIDEVRISKVVRYAAAFTPPAAAFADDQNTTALYHLESSGADSHVASGDTTPPVITSFTAAAGNAQVVCSWSGTDNVAITRWVLTRGGTTIYDGTGTSYTDTGRTNGTQYNYALTAYDAAGNVSSGATASATPSAQTVIAANDSGIIYAPYVWDTTGVRAATINPGAYAKVTLEGATSIVLNFDMTDVSSPVPRVKARVDGGGFVTYDLAANVALPLPGDNCWSVHHVEVIVAATSEYVNRWSPQNAIVKLTGITCGGTVTTRAAQPLTRKVLIYGDSITEGFRNLKNVNTPDGSDAAICWSHQQRYLLGAEVGVVGFGGQGWTSSGQGGVPGLTTAYTSLWSGTARSFSVNPDVVVVNMGENGGAVASTVTAWLSELLTKVGATTKVAVMRPFSGAGAAALQQAVSDLGNSRVTYVDTTGWWNPADAPDGGAHPSGASSLSSLGPRLANALAPLVGGAPTYRRFINKAGAVVGIG